MCGRDHSEGWVGGRWSVVVIAVSVAEWGVAIPGVGPDRMGRGRDKAGSDLCLGWLLGEGVRWDQPYCDASRRDLGRGRGSSVGVICCGCDFVGISCGTPSIMKSPCGCPPPSFAQRSYPQEAP